MDRHTMARRLHAASVALEHNEPMEVRDLLLDLCTELQVQLKRPQEPHTWRSADGTVWKVRDMWSSHIVNALKMITRNYPGPPSPLFRILYQEMSRRGLYSDTRYQDTLFRVDYIARKAGWLKDDELVSDVSPLGGPPR